MKINENLVKYIEEEIFPSYAKNDLGHNLEHIKYVIDRSLKFAKTVPDINYDMVYLIAAYHDIGHYIDAKNHAKISADMLLKDEKLKDFFDNNQITIMAEAVEDHSSTINKEPRNIYGKIVASADKPTSIDNAILRTYNYTVKHNPYFGFEEVIEASRQHLFDKFGPKGYGVKKMYFEDLDYIHFINGLADLTSDKSKFKERFINVVTMN